MASTYLSRTPSSTGNRRTFTFSTWLKRGSNFGSEMGVFTGGDDANATGFFTFYITTNDRIDAHFWNGSSFDSVTPNALLRDPSAWYHLVCAVDTTQATASDRIKIYINGTLQTSMFSTDYPNQNHDFNVNHTSIMQVGVRRNGTGGLAGYFDGEMAHTHLIDGTAYDADTFGETDSTTGIWKPKTAPSVTYGTNGFFLKFENSGAFGTDSSGNSNTFTVNGTMTQTIDTPSNVFATYNPLIKTYHGATFSIGNTKLVPGTTGQWGAGFSTLGASSGKWYCEIKPLTGASHMNGIVTATQADNGYSATDNYPGKTSLGWGYKEAGTLFNNASSSSYGNSYTNNDIIGIAMDLDNNYLYFSKNGTWQNSGDPTSGATGTGGINISSRGDEVMLFGGGTSDASSASNVINFGNGYFGTTAVSSAENPDDGIGIFEYDVPAGYRALCTKSINAEEYS